MQKKWTYVMLGALIGTAVSVTLAAPSIMPQAIADEQPAEILTALTSALTNTAKPAEFFKPNWTVEDSVSTEVLSQDTVRKIEAGRTSFVTVATTATGVYSSDGLSSNHVRYPGIHAEGQQAVTLALLGSGGWTLIRPVQAGSIEMVQTESGSAMVSDGAMCHAVNGSFYC